MANLLTRSMRPSGNIRRATLATTEAGIMTVGLSQIYVSLGEINAGSVVCASIGSRSCCSSGSAPSSWRRVARYR